MSTLLDPFLDPFSADSDEPDDWLVPRLVLRVLGALWLSVGLLLAVTHRFVHLLRDHDPDAPVDR